MITPDTFHHVTATGRRPRQPDRTHRRFRPAVHESHHFHRGQRRGDHRRQLRLGLCRRAVAGAAAHGFRKCRHHALVGMSDNHRPVASHVIDISILIDIRDDASLRLFDEQRHPPDRLKRAHRRRHPARHHLARFDKCGFRLDRRSRQFTHRAQTLNANPPPVKR